MAPATRSKPAFGTLNEHLICTLCSGYLVDATTISECLHSFCRSCIVQYLQSSSVCPSCKILLDKGCPLKSLKPDKTLQDIVYKLVPNLFSTEMNRRKVYYDNHPQYVDQTTPEQRGDSIDRFYSPDDSISLSLEYHGRRRLSLDSEDSTVNLNNNEEKTVPPKRYLKCPAMFTIGLLKKFIRLKFDLPTDFLIDIFQRESYPDEYTLLDIAYIYPWKRSEPMRFFYHVRDPRVPESDEDTEREMPALSAVMGTRSSRASRRLSNAAASPVTSARASPAPLSRKPRAQSTTDKVDQVEATSTDVTASRVVNPKACLTPSTPVSSKLSRALPCLKNAKANDTKPLSSGSKPFATDLANGSRCCNTVDCHEGQKCKSSIAESVPTNVSVQKTKDAFSSSSAGGHLFKTDVQNSTMPVMNDAKEPLSTPMKCVESTSVPKGLTPTSNAASTSVQKPVFSTCQITSTSSGQPSNGNLTSAQPTKENTHVQPGFAGGKPTPNNTIPSKVGAVPPLLSPVTSVRAPVVMKQSFTSTVTTKTTNGGFVTVKNTVQRSPKQQGVRCNILPKPPLILPKIAPTEPQAPAPRNLKPTSANTSGNQKTKKANSQIPPPSLKLPGSVPNGCVRNAIRSRPSSGNTSNKIVSPAGSEKSHSLISLSCSSGLKSNPNIQPRPSTGGNSETAPVQGGSQRKEQCSDEEKKVETAKAILQLSMGFKHSNTPTDAALHNRIDKIVKDLQREEGNVDITTKKDPMGPIPTPKHSPRASSALSANATSTKDVSVNAQKSNQCLNPLPKVDGLTITPIDAPKRKSTSSPFQEEKRFKLQEKHSLSDSNLKRPADNSKQLSVPSKVPKVDKIADTIKQKQEMLLQKREPSTNEALKPGPAPQKTVPTEQKTLPSSPKPSVAKLTSDLSAIKNTHPQQQQTNSSQQENGVPEPQSHIQQKIPQKASQQKTPLQTQTGQLNVSPNQPETQPAGHQLGKKVAGKPASPESPVKNKKPIPDLQRLQRPAATLANTTVNGSMSLAEVKEQLAKNGQYSPPGKQRSPPKLIELSQQRKSAPPAPPSSLHRDGYGALDLSSASPRAEHGGSWTPPPSIAQTLAKRQQLLAPVGHRLAPSSISSSSPSPPAESPSSSVSPELFFEQSLAQQQALLQHIRLQSLFQAQAAGLNKVMGDWGTVDRMSMKTPVPQRK